MRDSASEEERLETLMRKYQLDSLHYRIGIIWIFGLFFINIVVIGLVASSLQANQVVKGMLVFVFMLIPLLIITKSEMITNVGRVLSKHMSKDLRLALVSSVIIIVGLILITISLCALFVTRTISI